MFIIQKDSEIINILKIITKVLTIIIAMTIFTLLIVVTMYKKAYKVTLGEKNIGYIDNKEAFEEMLNNFLYQESEDIAYIDMGEKPQYSFILVKRDKKIDNEKIYDLVINTATVYKKVYVLHANDEEIATVKTQEEAEKLKTKAIESANNKTVNFLITEAHIVNPEISNNEEVINLVKAEYKAKTVKKYVLATKVAKAEYVNVNVSFNTPSRGIVTSRYGYRNSEFHKGIDIANPIGTPIYAAADGKVIFSGVRGNYGKLVIIQHEDNVITYYAHCADLLVVEGDIVTQGKQISTIGMTGRTTGPHVHFEVRINNECVNPTDYVKNIE